VPGHGWIRIVSALLLASWFLSSRGEAQNSLPLELSFQAPPECPSAEDVHAELERIAHARPGLTLAPLRAQVEVSVTPRRFVLHVQTEHEGQRGERHVEARDCATAVRSLTLILALTFGAGVELTAEGASAPEPEPEPKPTLAPPPPAPAEAAPAPSATAAMTRKWALFAGGFAHWGLAPNVAGTGRLGAELTLHPAFAVNMHAFGFAAAEDSPHAGVHAHYAGFGGAAHVCGRLPLSVLTGGLCGGGQASAIHGRARGDIKDASATAPWYALSLSALLDWPRDTRLRLRLEGGFDLSLNRPRFVIQGLGPVQHVSRLVPNVGLNVLLTL
jgi:hypothetical protein